MTSSRTRIFDWRSRRSWLSAIRHYAADILDDEVREHLERVRPRCWSDQMDWLPDHSIRIEAIADKFVGYYTHVKAFHGCRPASFGTLRQAGLRVQDPAALLRQFRAIYDDVPQPQLQAAEARMAEVSHDESGRIWLIACDKELVRACGHYMIQGSEYIQGLAVGLGPRLAQRLRSIGVPTVLEVDLPVSFVGDHQRLSLAREIAAAWGQLRTRRPLGADHPPCYVVRRDIPPEHIVGHYHPRQLRDPHNLTVKYINDRWTCDGCEDPLTS